MSDNSDNFLYLNSDNCWPGFQWDGLELRDDGGLHLFSLPCLEDPLPKEVAGLLAPAGPAGIALDWGGTIYLSDPVNNRIVWTTKDSTEVEAVEFKGNHSFNAPRGLSIFQSMAPMAQSKFLLFVVDSGHHCVRIFDFDLGTWTSSDPPLGKAGSGPSSDLGAFHTPWSIVLDADGNAYVVDYGNQRVQKFGPDRLVIVNFWDTMKKTGLLARPVDIALRGETEETIRLYVVDAAHHKVFVFNAYGQPIRDSKGNPLALGEGSLENPMGIAVAGGTVYVGDNQAQCVRVYKEKNEGFILAGEAVGYKGPVAALALDVKNRLLVHAGSVLKGPGATKTALQFLAVGKGYRTRGTLWRTFIDVDEASVTWHQVRARAQGISNRSHIQFFLHTGDDRAAAQLPVAPASDSPFPSPPWRTMPLDAPDLFIDTKPARYLSIGVQFLGDSTGTPLVSQMRVDFNHETYLRYLPGIYREDPDSRDLLVRFLSLFESFFDETGTEISDLTALFDIDAAPREVLPWLASCLALPLRNEFIRPPDESDADYETRVARWNRAFLQAALPLTPERGTLRGLEALLRAWLKGDPLKGTVPLLKERTADPFWFDVTLFLDTTIRELHTPLGVFIVSRAAKFLLDSEKPAHTSYKFHLDGLKTMQLAPAKWSDRRPGEIYAQVGETTLLWD